MMNMVIPANIPTVLRNSLTASSFFPSKYNLNGCKQNRYPITATESVRRDSITIGINILLSGSVVNVEKRFNSNTMPTIYPEAIRALYIGFLSII